MYFEGEGGEEEEDKEEEEEDDKEEEKEEEEGDEGEAEDKGEAEDEDKDEDEEKVEDEDEDEEKVKIYEKLMKDKAKNMDKYFGILYNTKNNEYVMGNKIVRLERGDIIVDGNTYKGTPGLWSLIMLKVPTDFAPEDMKEYKKLVEQTNVMANPQNQTGRSRPTTTYKWKNIFKKKETNKKRSWNRVHSIRYKLATTTISLFTC